MTSELYVKKAALWASKGEFEKAVESMNTVLELDDDTVAMTEAHCFLGEYYFINQNYELAKEHLEWISDRSEELEAEHDDLLNDEITTADVLLDMMEKFKK